LQDLYDRYLEGAGTVVINRYGYTAVPRSSVGQLPTIDLAYVLISEEENTIKLAHLVLSDEEARALPYLGDDVFYLAVFCVSNSHNVVCSHFAISIPSCHRIVDLMNLMLS
jgi:hypothetical protein